MRQVMGQFIGPLLPDTSLIHTRPREILGRVAFLLIIQTGLSLTCAELVEASLSGRLCQYEVEVGGELA